MTSYILSSTIIRSMPIVHRRHNIKNRRISYIKSTMFHYKEDDPKIPDLIYEINYVTLQRSWSITGGETIIFEKLILKWHSNYLVVAPILNLAINIWAMHHHFILVTYNNNNMRWVTYSRENPTNREVKFKWAP